jgi:hypothetical protein
MLLAGSMLTSGDASLPSRISVRMPSAQPAGESFGSALGPHPAGAGAAIGASLR